MRHAKAEQTSTTDFERHLAERGHADAADAGRWLAARGVEPELALVSAAVRTQETWDALVEGAGWDLHPDPLVYVYQSTLRPGAIKGWIVHEQQDDRLFLNVGVMRWVLYDSRTASPTCGLLNDLVFSERNRALLIIPRGVYHAVQNIGTNDAMFINMPTRPYDHGDPDKFRLPLHNDRIPFDFDAPPAW